MFRAMRARPAPPERPGPLGSTTLRRVSGRPGRKVLASRSGRRRRVAYRTAGRARPGRRQAAWGRRCGPDTRPAHNRSRGPPRAGGRLARPVGRPTSPRRPPDGWGRVRRSRPANPQPPAKPPRPASLPAPRRARRPAQAPPPREAPPRPGPPPREAPPRPGPPPREAPPRPGPPPREAPPRPSPPPRSGHRAAPPGDPWRSDAPAPPFEAGHPSRGAHAGPFAPAAGRGTGRPSAGPDYGPSAGRRPAPSGAPGPRVPGPGAPGAGVPGPGAPGPGAPGSAGPGGIFGGYAQVIRPSEHPGPSLNRVRPGAGQPAGPAGLVPPADHDVYVYRDVSDPAPTSSARRAAADDAAYWYDLLAEDHVPQQEETRGPFEPLLPSGETSSLAEPAGTEQAQGPPDVVRTEVRRRPIGPGRTNSSSSRICT